MKCFVAWLLPVANKFRILLEAATNKEKKTLLGAPLGTTAALLVVFIAVLIAAPGMVTAEDPPPEICDGIDNDGDGEIDEGFDVGADCSIDTTNEFGTCPTQGVKQCKADQTGTECVANGPLAVPSAEQLAANDASCFDNVDNDCDGDTDADDTNCAAATEMFCNGFDDDSSG